MAIFQQYIKSMLYQLAIIIAIYAVVLVQLAIIDSEENACTVDESMCHVHGSSHACTVYKVLYTCTLYSQRTRFLYIGHLLYNWKGMLHSHQMASVTMATITAKINQSWWAIVQAEYVHAPYTVLHRNTSAETMRQDAAFTPLHKNQHKNAQECQNNNNYAFLVYMNEVNYCMSFCHQVELLYAEWMTWYNYMKQHMLLSTSLPPYSACIEY